MGIAARGNFDLTQHGAGSGKSMEYFDAAANRNTFLIVSSRPLGLTDSSLHS